jgi:hypothetical protein
MQLLKIGKKKRFVYGDDYGLRVPPHFKGDSTPAVFT